MASVAELTQTLASEFSGRQAAALASAIYNAQPSAPSVSDFTERLGALTDRIEALAEAQQRTELKVVALVEAQQRTELKVEALAEAQRETQIEIRTLTQALNLTRSEVAGIGRTLGYALENEAYRELPTSLRITHGIELTERLIRTHVGDTEINIIGRGRRGNEDVIVVGESKSQIVTSDLEDLRAKVRVVKSLNPNIAIVPILVTHFARPRTVELAKKDGVIVVQSFEW